MLGIISGTIFLQGMDVFKDMKKCVSENEFGTANLMLSHDFIFIPRHGDNPHRHILPHAINHKANIKALQDKGVTEIISINSTGSLKAALEPGQLVIPDDFIMLSPYCSVYVDRPVHIIPRLDALLREHCLAAAAGSGVEVMDGGIYWQTIGPRLETKAEIKLMSHFADIVGMTMASEAIIAEELGLRYAAICSVDNYAHGIGNKDLTQEEIAALGHRSREPIKRIIVNYMANLRDR